MKAALYIRVSSEDQTDNFSLSAQLNLLNDYCKRNNIEVYKVYPDDGVSAKYTDEKKRPQFNQMIHDAGKKLFDIILVHKYDRFARNVELSQRVKRQIREAGINVISISEPVENSPIGFITEGLMELLSEYYIRNLSVETKKGHLERAKQGFHNGSVPFGYKIDHTHKSKMSINEEQAKIVRYIFDCHTAMGYGIAKTAKILNESNITGAMGGHWSPKSVKMILSNVKYIGMIKLGQNVYKGLHDAIVDEEIFEQSQTILRQSKELYTYTGNNHSKHYLLGMARCGVCGRAIVIRTSNGRKYYACSGNRRNYEKVCDNSMTFRTEILEEYVFNEINDILNGHSKIFTLVQRNTPYTLSEDRKKKLIDKAKRIEHLFKEGYKSFDDFKKETDEIDFELREIEKIITQENKSDVITIYSALWDEIKKYHPSDPVRFRNGLCKIVDCIMVSKEKIQTFIYAN